jgi:hypothetical protein
VETAPETIELAGLVAGSEPGAVVVTGRRSVDALELGSVLGGEGGDCTAEAAEHLGHVDPIREEGGGDR